MQRRARNPYINYHMMRFWPSLEMVLLTGFHSNLNLFASFGEDSASTWKLNTLRKLVNYSELLCWVLTSAKTATASSPTITWTKYLHGSNQQEAAGDFFLGDSGIPHNSSISSGWPAVSQDVHPIQRPTHHPCPAVQKKKQNVSKKRLLWCNWKFLSF